MSRVLRVLGIWFPLAVTVTALCGLIYLTAQQVLRMGANDPQIQMAEDAASSLDSGEVLKAVVPQEQVELSRSLASFVVIYDRSGKPVAGSGMLDGQLPDYPLGALEAAKNSGENRVTWQPQPGVRIASVVVPYQDGAVMAGRNMREVESNIDQVGTLVVAGWLASLAATLIAAAVASLIPR